MKSSGDARNGTSIPRGRVLAWGGRRELPQGLGDEADVIAVMPAKQEDMRSCFEIEDGRGQREIPKSL